MRIPRAPHHWEVSPGEAAAIQERLSRQVRLIGLTGEPRLIAGVDCSFSREEERCLAAAVLWDRGEGRVVESSTSDLELHFPYIPGLLSFREAPAALAALAGLKSVPGALLCDGQGLAHPRRFGLACHLGLIAGLPTVGCAKSRLLGEYREPEEERGSWSELVDRGEVVGAVLRTRSRVRPLFVSVGHRINLEAAVRLVLACGRGYRLPEPLRQAHRLVTELKRGRAG